MSFSMQAAPAAAVDQDGAAGAAPADCAALPAGYTLVAGPPPLDEYLRLRRETGLTPKTAEQGAPALANSWSWVHVRAPAGAAGAAVAAMGRVMGDGGWYYVVCDMATGRAHQRRGLGRHVLAWLLRDIRARSPPGAYITLTGDPPGQPLYRSLGFADSHPSIGMYILDGAPAGRQ